jgi:hypothetical protein
VFSPSTQVVNQNQTRRFYLVGKLNGTATSGESFNARLDAMSATSALPGQINTVPTADSTALIIDIAVLNVSSGPNKPANILRKAGAAAQLALGQLRFGATNNVVDINALTLTAGGTGDWVNDFAAGTGVQLWLDDGDGVFSSTGDQKLAEAGGSAGVVLGITPALTIQHATTRDVWVVVNLLDSAGVGAAAAPDTYTLSLTGPGSLNITGTPNIVFSTTAPPNSASLSIIDFYVTDFQPPKDLLAGGAAITMTGSGFMSPVTVKIDGVVCPGTAVVSGGGTQISGIFVPPRIAVAKNLPIEVTSGTLPPEVLTTHTFEYTVKDSSGGKRSDGGSGCAGGDSAWAAMLGLLALLGAVAVRRRTA